jgi:hypothetical protein
MPEARPAYTIFSAGGNSFDDSSGRVIKPMERQHFQFSGILLAIH